MSARADEPKTSTPRRRGRFHEGHEFNGVSANRAEKKEYAQKMAVKKRNARFITIEIIRQLEEMVETSVIMSAEQAKKDPKGARKQRRMVDLLVQQLIHMAVVERDTTCMKMILDRVEGYATQSIVLQDERQESDAPRANYTREQLMNMSANELSSLYRESILEGQRASGAAGAVH